MNTIPFTTCVAIDVEHVGELKQVLPTWQRHRPEIFQRPLKVIADFALLEKGRRHKRPPNGLSHDVQFLIHSHPDVEFIQAPDMSGATQRAKMLTAMTLLAPFVVDTPWLLKVDADTLASRTDPAWCSADMIQPVAGVEPVYLASPWGYTIPCDAIAKLDDWGDTVPELAKHPRLNLPYDPQSRIVSTPGRMASWVFFGRVDWLRWAAGLCKELPVPSHDSWLSYIALRTKAPVRHQKMRRFGWQHAAGWRLTKASQDAMGN